MTRNVPSPLSPELRPRPSPIQTVTSVSPPLLSDTVEGYVVTDGAGTIQEINREAAALLRSTPAALRGKPMLRYLERESRKLFLSLLRRLHTSAQVEALEVALQPQQGSVIHATLTMLASRDATGKFLTLHCHLSNVNTHLWHASLRAQNADTPTAPEKTPGTTLFTHDLNGTILFVSHALASALGYQSQQMVGHSLAEFLILAEQQQFSNYLQITQHGPVLDRVLRLSTKTGKEYAFPYRHLRYEVAGRPLYIHLYTDDDTALVPQPTPRPGLSEGSERYTRDRAEELVRINAALQKEIADRTRAEEELKKAREELERRVAARTVELSQANILLEQEISERRQAQEALRDSEARYRLLSASAPIGIAQADINGEIVYTNARWQALAGLPSEVTLGRGWLQAIHPDDRTAVATAWTTAIRGGHEFSQEWRLVLPNGDTRWVHARATPLQSSEGDLAGYVSTLEDVTAQKSTQALLQEEAQVSRGQTIALAQTLKALTAEPALDSFLSQVLTAIAQQLRAQRASLWLYEKAEENFSPYMVCENGKTKILAHSPASAVPVFEESQFWPELVQTHRPILVTDLAHEQRLIEREALRTQGIRTILLVPLVLEDEATGWLSLHSTEINSYRPEEIELAQALAQQVALAMQLANFAEQRRQAAIVEERNRLAREIHDTLAQGLTGIVIQLEAAKEVLTVIPETARSHIVRAAALARESLREARRSVRALRPQVLDQQDLPTALEHLAVQLGASTQVPITFVLRGAPFPLPAEVAANLLRISQEAIVNAWKHAQPHTISLTLSFDSQEVQLRIHDDGRGFDVRNSPAGSGFGLTSMRERAERLGGIFMIASAPGQGTEVTVTVPNSQLS